MEASQLIERLPASVVIAAVEADAAADLARGKRREAGITVLDLWADRGAKRSSKRWLFRVRDKQRRSYLSEAFAEGEKAKGWVWALDQRASLRLGFTSSGALPFAAVAKQYHDDQVARGLNEVYTDEVKRLADAVIAAGAIDLRAEGFANTVRDWIANAPCFPKDGGARLKRAEERVAAARERVRAAEEHVRTVERRRLRKAERRLAKAQAYRQRIDARLAIARDEAEARTPAPSTKNRWLVILKSIAKLAVTKYGLRTNPLSGIKRFKQDTTVKNALRLDELRAMVADARAADAYYRQACLMVYAGTRCDEAAHVRREWVDRAAHVITLRVIRDGKGRVVWAPKGNKERIIPVLDELDDLLTRWDAEDRAAGVDVRSGYLIGDEQARRLEDKGHWKEYRAYLDRCGIDGKARDLSPHCQRHTWTALMLATGASPNRVRRWLGHAKLSTTDIYADAEAMYEHIVQDWPRAQFRLRPQALAPAKPTFVLDADADPLAFLHAFVGTGGRARLEQLATESGVPVTTLRAWFIDGAPESVRAYLQVLAACARLSVVGASPLPPATPIALGMSGVAALPAPAGVSL